MRGIRQALTVTVLAAALGAGGGAAHAGKLKVLHSFCKGHHRFCGDGSNPQGGLVMDAAGNLYGTAARGGKNLRGTVFELERKESGNYNFKTIYRFCGNCGVNPSGPLIVDTQGNLYGTANNLVFKLSPQADEKLWHEDILYRFCSQQNCADGNTPVGGLTYAGAATGAPYDGSAPLYGTTGAGGANGFGTVFELSSSGGNWSEVVLYSFCSTGGTECTDGAGPGGGLVMDDGGYLYGMTPHGGENNVANQGGGAGVLYRVSSQNQNSWTETVLHQFCSSQNCVDGAYPFGTPTLDSAGDLLGSTGAGGGGCEIGEAGCGTIFRLNPSDGAYEVLYTFCQKNACEDGYAPVASPIVDPDGTLFGTTENGGGNNIDVFGRGGGVAYELSPTSYRVLHHFCSLADCADGEYPEGQLIIESLQTLLGTTSLGGAFGGQSNGGTVFRLTP